MTNHDHIATSEILQDIKDTQAEIATMERELNGLSFMDDRLSQMKRAHRIKGILDRQRFIDILTDIIFGRES